MVYSRLLFKLRRLGTSESALRWVFSYLTDRSQAVVGGDGGCSGCLTTLTGVPQDSALGPLLFFLFINHIAASLRYFQHLIFADDTQIYFSCLLLELETSLNRIAHDVGIITAFVEENSLKLNLSKSRILIQGSNAFISRITHIAR